MFQLRASKQLAALTVAIMLSGSFSAHAETSCKTRSIVPGIASVTAIVKGSATAEDAVLCSDSFRCPAGARRVHVLGSGTSSSPLAYMGVEASATATNNTESILSDCEALARTGKGKIRACSSLVAELQQPDNVVEEAQCTTFASAPANGSIVATATCACKG